MNSLHHNDFSEESDEESDGEHMEGGHEEEEKDMTFALNKSLQRNDSMNNLGRTDSKVDEMFSWMSPNKFINNYGNNSFESNRENNFLNLSSGSLTKHDPDF